MKTETIRNQDRGGERIEVNYYFASRFRFGRVLICRNSLVYIFDGPNIKKKDVLDFEQWPTDSEAMQALIEAVSLKESQCEFFNGGPGLVAIIKKKPDCVSLSDLEALVPDDVLDTSLMWVTSKLLKVGVFLFHNGFSLNPIDYRNVYVSASSHTILLPEFRWSITSIDDEDVYVGSIKSLFRSMSTNIDYRVEKWINDFHKTSNEALTDWDEIVNDIHDVEDQTERPYVPLVIDIGQLYS